MFEFARTPVPILRVGAIGAGIVALTVTGQLALAFEPTATTAPAPANATVPSAARITAGAVPVTTAAPARAPALATAAAAAQTTTSATAASTPPFLPAPVNDGDAGFTTIFDGQSLKGWEGDPAHWRVENGTLVGESTSEAPLKAETFLIWRGGQPADFDLRAEYRVSNNGNSGITYRSVESATAKYTIDGYQLDIDGRAWGEGFNTRVLHKNGADCPRITGQIVGRVFYALPGQLTHVADLQHRSVIGSFGDCATVTRALSDDWNVVDLIARGNLIIHIINGQVMAALIDEEPSRVRAGKIGLQLHGGVTTKVEFRNIRIKLLESGH